MLQASKHEVKRYDLDSSQDILNTCYQNRLGHATAACYESPDTTLSGAPSHTAVSLNPSVFQDYIMTTLSIPQHAVTWFEIGCSDLSRSEAFYGAVLNRKMDRREEMGPSMGSVFPYETGPNNIGGCLMQGVSSPRPVAGGGGTLVYLDASPSLGAALARVAPAGGSIALPTQALPEGMGFFAHIIDLDGNRVGLHALAQ
jgi:uncharacterized protein